MSARRTAFYLDRRNRKWSGVCAGLADFTGINVSVIRIGAILLTLIGGFPWTLIAYWLTAWLAEDKPREFYDASPEDRKFWQDVRARPAATVRDVRSRFRDIDRRLADVETHITSHNRRLADEIEALR